MYEAAEGGQLRAAERGVGVCGRGVSYRVTKPAVQLRVRMFVKAS